VFVERALSIGAGEDGLPCPFEGDEERVSLVVDLGPAVGSERLAEDAVAVGERDGVPLSQLFEQRRRALDVGEQEGRSGSAVLAHAATTTHGGRSAQANGGPMPLLAVGDLLDPPPLARLRAGRIGDGHRPGTLAAVA